MKNETTETLKKLAYMIKYENNRDAIAEAIELIAAEIEVMKLKKVSIEVQQENFDE